MVTHLCCLDVRAEASQGAAELGAVWLHRHAQGSKSGFEIRGSGCLCQTLSGFP